MSTRYTTIPPIKYEDFLLGKSFNIQKLPICAYTIEHILIEKNDTYLYVYKNEENGNIRFERCGTNSVSNIFPSIIEEFNVKIFDEYGIEFK